MEIARVLGSMVKSGWRPRRTIVFASWAVEEYGLEGSYEYVYDNINKITNRYMY
jgi:Zn-dependent M28 family amino/carboxypeptidase